MTASIHHQVTDRRWERLQTLDHRPVRIFHQGFDPKGDFDAPTILAYGVDSAATAIGRILLCPVGAAAASLRTSKNRGTPKWVALPRALAAGTTVGVVRGSVGAIWSVGVALPLLLEGTFLALPFAAVCIGRSVIHLDKMLSRL